MDTLDQPVVDTLSPDVSAAPAQPVAPVSATPTSSTQPVAKNVANWYDGLTEDLKNNPTVQKYKTQEDQVKAHLELQSLLGHNKVALPKDDKDVVAIAHLNKALGVPEAPGAYKLDDPTPLPGMEQMQFGMDEFKGFAHKHGLTQKQAANIMQDYTGRLAGIKENAEKEYIQSIEAAKAELTKEWGMAYEQKVKLAQSVMNKFAGDKETFDYINSTDGADPIKLRIWAKIGESFTEGSLGAPSGQSSSFTKTPAEAKAEYEKIMSDPNDIYWAGVRNNVVVQESIRKERVSYVEGLMKMHMGYTK